MRLSDVVNQGKRRLSEGANFVRHPMQSFLRIFRREGQKIYERAEIPIGQSRRAKSQLRVANSPRNTTGNFHEHTPDQRYVESPVSVAVRPTVLIPKSVGQTPDSALAKDKDTAGNFDAQVIKSRWDRYQIEDLIEVGDNFYLYAGRSNSSDETVFIKKYQLSRRNFSLKDIEKRQQMFEQLVHLNRKIAHGPDFRLVRLIDAACDRKSHACYLITKPVEQSCSLATYINEYGTMPAAYIREVLRQGLETLQFLHLVCWIRFSTERFVKGIPHGNLSLNSLSIRFLDTYNPALEQQFFIYVADLALWEHLMLPPQAGQLYVDGTTHTGNLSELKQQDLEDLAKVVFQLAGGSFDSAGKPQELCAEYAWEDLEDKYLWRYLRRLWGLDTPFASVQAALDELRLLPSPVQEPIDENGDELSVADALKSNTLWLKLTPLLLVLSLIGVSGTAWWFLSGNRFSNSSVSRAEPQQTRFIGDVSVPSLIQYGVETDSIWKPSLHHALGQSANPSTLVSSLEDRYQRYRQPPLKLAAVAGETVQTHEQVLQQVMAGKADIGFVQALPSSKDSFESHNLRFEAVANDGLAVFVPFGDAYRSRHSIGKLGRTITVTELRQLYTGTTDLPQFRGQTVKLFFPEEETVIALFETMVLDNDPELIIQFRALHEQVRSRDMNSPIYHENKIRDSIYEKLLFDFETNGTIGLGFDRIGSMFNQCAVYPLAVGQGQQATQILRQANDQPIRPTTDLCNAKGSYWPEVPDSYSLKLELGLVFAPQAEAGEAFTQMLRTVEGQYLLSEAGLIPQMPMEQIWQEVWGASNE